MAGEPDLLAADPVVGVLGDQAVLYCPYTGGPAPDSIQWRLAGYIYTAGRTVSKYIVTMQIGSCVENGFS